MQANTKLAPLPKSPTKMRMELLSKEQILPESTITNLALAKEQNSVTGKNRQY